MKIFLGNRLVALLLALVMVLGLVPVVATPKIDAATPDYAALKTQIQGFQYPMGSTMHWPVGNTGAVDGIYLLTSTLTRENTKGFTLNPSMEESNGGYVGYGTGRSEIIPNTSTDLIGASRSSYSILKGNATSFTIQNINQLYWNFESITNQTVYGALRLRSAVNGNQFYIGTSSGRYHIIRHKTNNWYLHSNSWTFRASIKFAPQGSTNGDENQFWICKVNEEAFYLRDALQDATTYLVSNSTGRFHAEAYENFLTTVQAASDYYASIKRTVWSAINNTVTKSHKDAVYDAMARLRLSDSTQSYIDIPIEILDFRGDGILFENSDVTPYSLSLGGAFASYPENFPGWNNGVSAAGLAYDTLVDGHIVHTKATVDYVAGHLSKHTALVTPGRQMNGIIYNKIKSGTLTYNANGYSDTIKKCHPAIEGGKLYWDDVKTYHDLAYYLLSHMWKESEDIIGTDTLANGTSYATTYNMRVNELKKLRLFKNGTTYSYKSSELSSYSQDGYILNIMNNALGKPSIDPQFQPIDGKGFESSNLYGGATETPYTNGHNWLFTLHAYGSFIYTEDANLEFTFTGDDDVYFYVNNTLACDIGGMHGAATSGVKLNDIADKLKLKDGQICRFDMFYAERHTIGVNLNFTTNIQIMDESVVTEKTQYDPATNQSIMDGAAVNTGTEIAYSFGLTNRRTAPITDLKLTDSKLGVTLDGAEKTITLTDLTIDNIQRSATDLTVVYSGYNIHTSEVSSDSAQPLSFEEMKTLIQEAVASTDSGSPLETGVYSYAVESEANLLALLELGLPASCKMTVKGFRHNMGDGLFTNSLTTRCTPIKYTPNAEGGITKEYGEPINGSASCRCFGMSLDLVSVNNPYAVVLDYGKSIDVDLPPITDTITTAQGVEVSYIGSTFNGSHGTVKTTEPINLTFTKADQKVDMDTVQYTMTSAQKLRFVPKCFMEEINTFWAVYKVTVPSLSDFKPYYIMKAVSFLPATMVYYEAENFTKELSYTEKRTTGANTETPITTIFNSWGQAGAANAIKEEGTTATDNLQEFHSVGTDHPYGYDPSYKDDTLLSNGKSLYVEGAGVIVPNGSNNDNYTQIVFSFLGTGFDLISRTNPSQGSIRVSVYSDEEMTANHREKTVTVNNYGELNLYQIPVVSMQNLPYGMHHVSVEVHDEVHIPFLGLSYGNQFYLDAIRIYDPIDVTGDNLNEDQELVYNTYRTDKEAHPVVKEIRDSLLEGAKTEGLTELTAGAMFVDTKAYTNTPNSGNSTGSQVQVSEHLAVSAATYGNFGPKNEVYLSPGQAIAFKLDLAKGKIPARIDVGAKTIMGDKATLAAGFVGTASTDSSTLTTLTTITENMVTSTAMYYALDISKLSSEKDNYLVIFNAYGAGNYSAENPGNILSITDLKVTYDSEPVKSLEIKQSTTEPFFFAVDNRTLEAAAVFMRDFSETPILDKNPKIMHSLNLSSDISINYVVEKALLKDCESFSLEVEIPIYEGNQKIGVKHTTLLPVEKDSYYYFTLMGVTAVQMNDEIQAVLHWSKDGQAYYSDTDVYSVSQYAYTQMNKTNDESLKVLCADLLCYGAQAQIFKGYRLDALTDSKMTEEQKGYCTDLDTVTFGNTNVILQDLENPTVTWVGKTLNLGSKVALKFIFSTKDYRGNLADLNLRLRYTNIAGKTVTATVRKLEAYNVANGQYAFSFDGLLAAELRSVLSVQIYEGDKPVSCPLQYSADTYGNNKIGTLGALCKALFAYSDSAKAYFQ